MKKIELDKNKELNVSVLTKFGFVLEKGKYIYKYNILNDDFTVIIEIKNNEIISKLIDNSFGEEYSIVDVDSITGEYIGKVKDAYNDVINSFLNNCTVFRRDYHDQVKEVIDYIRNKYNDDIEYLWDISPDSGIFRNKKNNKWYAAILSVKDNRVGGNSEDIIMVIDLMYYKGETLNIVDNKNIYPGYHMNKNSWITIRLDGTQKNDFIYKYIDLSYELSIKK